MQKTAALFIASIAVSPALALPMGNYQLIYNAADGSLTVDTNGNDFIGYLIQGAGFDPTQQNKPFSGIGESRADWLSDINTSTSLSGLVDLGEVLPSGLSISEFAQSIAGTLCVPGLGQASNPFELVYYDEFGGVTSLGDSDKATNQFGQTPREPRGYAYAPPPPSATTIRIESGTGSELWFAPVSGGLLPTLFSSMATSTTDTHYVAWRNLPEDRRYLLFDYAAERAAPLEDSAGSTAGFKALQTPEPGSAALLGAPLALIARRRRRRTA